jgi:hypothetical protein
VKFRKKNFLRKGQKRMVFILYKVKLEDKFWYIVYNFEVKQTLFAEAGKIIPKSIIDLSSPIKMSEWIGLKISD